MFANKVDKKGSGKLNGEDGSKPGSDSNGASASN